MIITRDWGNCLLIFLHACIVHGSSINSVICSLTHFVVSLFFALTVAPFSYMASPKKPEFTGTITEFTQLADEDAAMDSEYSSDQGDFGSRPPSPPANTHPDDPFYSQLVQPPTTPTIIRTAQILSLPLPPSRAKSHASSTSTVRASRQAQDPYPSLSQ